MISSGRQVRERNKLGVESVSVCIHKCLMCALESDLGTSNLQNTMPSAHSANIKVKNLVNIV